MVPYSMHVINRVHSAHKYKHITNCTHNLCMVVFGIQRITYYYNIYHWIHHLTLFSWEIDSSIKVPSEMYRFCSLYAFLLCCGEFASHSSFYFSEETESQEYILLCNRFIHVFMHACIHKCMHANKCTDIKTWVDSFILQPFRYLLAFVVIIGYLCQRKISNTYTFLWICVSVHDVLMWKKIIYIFV